MSPEQQTAAALAASMPSADMSALFNAGAGMPNQLQAMYMASMYPFYAQQAAAMQFPFMGIPGVPPMMGFPGGFPMMGFPGMNGMLPDMRSSGFPPMMSGAPGFPGMPPSPFPGMNGINGMGMPGAGIPQELSAYYQKMFEAQAAAAMAAAAMTSTPDLSVLDSGIGQRGMDLGLSGEREGLKRTQGRGANSNLNSGNGGLPPHHHHHNSHSNAAHGEGGDSPLQRRDYHSGGEQGQSPFAHDSPSRRHHHSSGDAAAAGGGSARKNSRREGDDKRTDALLDEFKMNKSRKFNCL
jgi:hypothetical protein